MLKKNIIFLMGIFWSINVLAQNVGLRSFEQNEKIGFKNAQGEIVIPASFDYATPFNSCGIAAVVDSSGWRYIDVNGKELFKPFIFDNGPDEISEGLSRFVQNGKVGFVDTCGKIAIEAVYDFAAPFQNGKAIVCVGCHKDNSHDEHATIVGGSWGVIDKTGKLIEPLSPKKSP